MATKTFAQEAKSIMNRYKTRLGDKFDKGDTLSLEAMNKELADLRQRQEAAREEEEATVFANGGKLPRKANAFLKRDFDISLGRAEPLSDFLGVGGPNDRVLGRRGDSGLETYRRAKARGYNVLDTVGFAGPGAGTLRDLMGSSVRQKDFKFDPVRGFGMFQKGGKLPIYANGGGFKFPEGGTTETFDPTANGGEGAWVSGDFLGTGGGDDEAPAYEPYETRVPWWGAAATAVGSILANRQLDLPEYNYEEYDPTQRAANLVDYSRAREQTLRERDLANAIIARNARGRQSQAGLMETILAGTTGTQRTTGTEFGKSLEQQQNINAQIKNQVAAENARLNLSAAQMNARNKMYASQIERENALINAQRRDQQIGGIFDSVTGYGRDLMAADKYDQMLDIMKPENYDLVATDDSWIRKALGISPKAEMINVDTGQRLST